MVRVMALVGCAAAMIGLAASVVSLLGLTPAWLYERSPALSGLTTRQLVGGVPIEWWILVGFVGVWMLARRSLAHKAVPHLATRGLSLCAAGYGAAILWSGWDFPTPMDVVLLAAAGIAIVSTWRRVPVVSLPDAVRMELREAAVTRRSRLVLLAFVAASIGGASALQVAIAASPIEQARSKAFRNWYAKAMNAADRRFQGTDAVRVTVFSDFQCEYCASEIPEVGAAISQLNQNGDVKFELAVMDFPLEEECNAAVSGTFHGMACEAAVAARIVRETAPTSYNAFAEWLYVRGPNLSEEALLARLQSLNLTAKYRAEYAATLDKVKADVSVARSIDVRGTPTFVVNGVVLPGGPLLLNAALELEQEARSQPGRRGK